MTTSSRQIRTADGTNMGAFGPAEWTLLAATSFIWGSSFLWIAIGLDVLHPGAVAFLRILLGALAVSCFPSARTRVDRQAMPAVFLVGIFGTLAPALFFAFAEQRVESSVAGMVQSTAPLLILTVSIVMSRKSPGRPQVLGLLIGFVGGVVLAWPNVVGADAEPLGVLLVIGAIGCYSISSNLLPPLVQQYGGAAIMARALWICTVLSLPYGAWGLSRSEFSWSAAIAMAILGIFGTGVGRTLFAVLVARAGAPRAAMVSYFIPVVAVMLGVVFRDDTVSVVELIGLAIIMSAAWFISRAQHIRSA